MLSQMQETILIIFRILVFSWKVLFHLIFLDLGLQELLKEIGFKTLAALNLKIHKDLFSFPLVVDACLKGTTESNNLLYFE